MAKKKEISVEEKLRALFDLQIIDSRIDEIRNVRGELPLEVEDLDNEIAGMNVKMDQLNSDLAEFDLAVKEHKNTIEHAKELISKYGLNGIPRKYFEDKNANLQYEYPVPETNNILYYTLERIDGTAIDYADRKDKMNEYFGEGPLDFLFPKLNPKGEAFW